MSRRLVSRLPPIVDQPTLRAGRSSAAAAPIATAGRTRLWIFTGCLLASSLDQVVQVGQRDVLGDRVARAATVDDRAPAGVVRRVQPAVRGVEGVGREAAAHVVGPLV